jgi:hypothetical protein
METREQGEREMRRFLVELERSPGATLESLCATLVEVRAHLRSLPLSDFVSGHSAVLEYAEGQVDRRLEKAENCRHAIAMAERKVAPYQEGDPRRIARERHIQSMQIGLARALMLDGVLVDQRARAARKVNGRSR